MGHHAPRSLIFILFSSLALHAAGVAFAADGAYAPAESAAVARAEWAAMRKARAAGDLTTAVQHAARAHSAWPGQWVYAYGLASVAAAAGDVGQTMTGLLHLTALGAAPDLAQDTTLVRFAREKLSATGVLDRAERAAADRGAKNEIAFRFPPADSAFWPEGIAYDAGGDAFFLTSVREGRIARVDSSGQVHPFARVAPSGWSALGVAVDTTADRVWVGAAALPQSVGYVTADSGRGAILAYERTTGKEVARFELPSSSEGHVPGDVLVTPNGDVYVSDSGQPILWRIHGGVLERFVSDPGFRSLQGMALSRIGSRIYIADYSHGIASIELDSRVVAWLAPPAGATVLGIDGMVAHPLGGLVAVQNGIVPARVVWIMLDERGSTPRLDYLVHVARDRDQADEPTLLTVADTKSMRRTLYVANSQWEKYDETGKRLPGKPLTPPLVLVAPTMILGDGPKPVEISATRWKRP